MSATPTSPSQSVSPLGTRTDTPTGSVGTFVCHDRTDPDRAYVVIRSRIQHLPDRRQSDPAGTDDQHPHSETPGRRRQPRRTRPHLQFLCAQFIAHGACPSGDACADVHVDAAFATAMVPHRLIPTPTSHPRARPPSYPAEVGSITIAPPNSTRATRVVRASECLVTKALGVDGTPACTTHPLSACAHFVQKGICCFGAACIFVHPLALPPPAASDAEEDGRNRNGHRGQLIPSSQSRSADNMIVPVQEARAVAMVASATAACQTVAKRATPRAVSKTDARSATATAATRQAPHRFQHDPYTAHGWTGRRRATLVGDATP